MKIGSPLWTDYTAYIKSLQNPYIGSLLERSQDYSKYYHPSSVPVTSTISDEAKLYSVNRFFDPTMHAGNYQNALDNYTIYKAAEQLTNIYEKAMPADAVDTPDWSAMSSEEKFEYMSKLMVDENGNLKILDPVATAKNIGKNADMAVFFDADVILKDIKLIGSQSIGNTEQSSGFQIDEKLETLASVYAFYEKQAALRFEGEDYDRAMSEVEKAMDVAIDEYAGSLLGDGPYTEGIDKEAVRSSMRTIFDERKDVYMRTLNDESFATGFEGTENEWVSRSSWFISNKLQSVVANSADALGVDTETQADYNIADLKAFAVMNEMTQTDSIQSSNAKQSEEELGYLLGVDKAMMETMIQGGHLSEKGEQALRESYEIGFSKLLDKTDEYLEMMHKDPFAREGGYHLYSAINRNVVKRAVDAFANTLTEPDKPQNNEEAYTKATSRLESTFFRKQKEKYEQGSGESRYCASTYGKNQSYVISRLEWNQENRALTMPKVFDYLNEYFR